MLIAFNYTGHLFIGTLVGLAFAKTPAEMAVIMWANLLPDIDHPQSTFGRFNPFAKWMTHRGFTHSLSGAVVLSLPFLFVGKHLFWLVLVGCLTHILSDWAIGLLPKKQSLPLRFW